VPLSANRFTSSQVRELSAQFQEMTLTETLAWAWDTFGNEAAIGTSFQGAGLVTIHHAVKAGLPFPVFTLDTGLLFPETYALRDQLNAFFGTEIELVKPELTLEQQAAENGPELWNRAPDACCSLRKVLPLQRKLSELSVWITGVRQEQSDSRSGTQLLELYHFDVLRDRYILKLNPMANWSRQRVWDYIREHHIPYNPLQDRGYRSIGCVPCTRPVGEGENERAGRWTGFDKVECGIHTFLGAAI
jgi:phosphoadenosine phosphosulfate reductase